MKKIYLLKERFFEYDNRQVSSSEKFTIRKIYPDIKSAKTEASVRNIKAYRYCLINMFISPMENNKSIWNKIEHFINVECKEQLNGKKFDTSNISQQIPSLNWQSLERIHQIVGIESYVVEETIEKNKIIVSYCAAQTDGIEDECPVQWLKHKEYDNLKDLMSEMIPILIRYFRTDRTGLYLDKSYGIISDDLDGMQEFISQSKYFKIEKNDFDTEYLQINRSIPFHTEKIIDKSVQVCGYDLEYSRRVYNPDVIEEVTRFLELNKNIFFETLKI